MTSRRAAVRRRLRRSITARAALLTVVVVAVTVAVTGLQQSPSPHRVNPYLPWHGAVLDRDGKLLAWYRPDENLGYDRVLRLGWTFLERRVPVDRRTGLPVYLLYPVFDERTLQGVYWQHDPASLFASFVESLLPWYAYSGDRRAIGVVRGMLDYQLAHGTTPAHWDWPSVPTPTSCAGETRYGRCLAGLPQSFYGGIEPDKVALLGLAYARFYELTGIRRYLTAALRCADALARHVQTGDARHTPWPFRVDGRTGRTLGGAVYGGMVVAPVLFLDELLRLRVGDASALRHARDVAWRWILRYPLTRGSGAYARWSGFYEDMPYAPRDVNGVSATTTAYFLLTRKQPSAVDPAWQAHARQLLQWVRTVLGHGPFYGAWGIDEQRTPPSAGCCSPAGLGSDTARWALANALLFERTGDRRARETAVRSFNYATYFARDDGLVSCCGAGFQHPYWFSDGYGDYIGSFSQALGALPELAPRGQDHLLGSSSVVQDVSYSPRRLAYRTFDRDSVEVIRLGYRPFRVLAGGVPLELRSTPAREGYSVEPLAGGDVVVRVHHRRARTVVVLGAPR